MFTGQQIRDKRLSLKWSAERLAKHLKTKLGNIYKWELGKIPRDPETYTRVDEWINDNVKPTEAASDFKEKYIALLERTNATLEAAIKKLTK